jgi:hypothetical protein
MYVSAFIELSSSHRTEFIFAKEKLPDGIIITHSEHVKAFSQQNTPVSVSISPIITHKALFSDSSYAFIRWNGFI